MRLFRGVAEGGGEGKGKGDTARKRGYKGG